MNNQLSELLGIWYEEKDIYFKNVIRYSSEDQTISMLFQVPETHSYTKIPVWYVTAEEYIRCLSQAAFIMLYLLIMDNGLSLKEVGAAEYKNLAAALMM